MYATLTMGGLETSHKLVDRSRSWILNLYYTNKVCLPPKAKVIAHSETNSLIRQFFSFFVL